MPPAYGKAVEATLTCHKKIKKVKRERGVVEDLRRLQGKLEISPAKLQGCASYYSGGVLSGLLELIRLIGLFDLLLCPGMVYFTFELLLVLLSIRTLGRADLSPRSRSRPQTILFSFVICPRSSAGNLKRYLLYLIRFRFVLSQRFRSGFSLFFLRVFCIPFLLFGRIKYLLLLF